MFDSKQKEIIWKNGEFYGGTLDMRYQTLVGYAIGRVARYYPQI
jgi:hypothetical protein